jgi:hypothetical protein
MLRINVTTLESYRRYTREVTPLDTEERLIEKLQGGFKGNAKTRVGEAFHTIIEKGQPCLQYRQNDYSRERDLFRVGDVYFTAPQVKLAMDYRNAYPGMIHEVPIFKVYEVPRLGEILVTMKTDGILGRHVHDAKVKFRPPNVEEYLDSYQWRFYLDILGVDLFTYHFWEVLGFNHDTPPEIPFIDLSTCHMVDHEPLNCYRYLRLSEDCKDLVVDFMEYIHFKNYYTHLKNAQVYADTFI